MRQSKRKNRFVRIQAGTVLLIFLLLCMGCTSAAREETAGEGEKAGAGPEEATESDLEDIRRKTEEKIMQEFDFSGINESLEKILPGERLRFQDVTAAMMEGDLKTAGRLLLQYIKEKIVYGSGSNKQNLLHMLLIAVIAAVFTNFSGALQNKQASKISFYILYLLLIILCLNAFQIAMTGMEERLTAILDFMRVLCPGYFLAVAIASGSGSALMFYDLVLILIFLVEAVILHFLLPMIDIYIMLQVMDYLLGEDALSEFAGLIRKFITWMLKTLLGFVIGVSVVQGLLGPVIDSLKRNVLTKSVEAIPGIGNTFGGISDVVLGTAVLIKNSIGMAGAVILLLICSAPVIQMMSMMFLYKLTAALVQPVSDKRITGCISSVSEGYALMLQVLFTTAVLFLITIAVVASSTS